MTTAHPTTPLKIPARKLRKGDKISMGVIAAVELTGKHVMIDFESRIGKHGTAFPPDLEVTVLNRGPAALDVVAELTTLVTLWEQRALTRLGESCPLTPVRQQVAEAGQLSRCAAELRELIGRLA